MKSILSQDVYNFVLKHFKYYSYFSLLLLYIFYYIIFNAFIIKMETIKSNKLKKIYSEAYPKSDLGELKRIRPISNIHRLLLNIQNEEGSIPSFSNIIYDRLTVNQYEEMVDLFKEWFPLKYKKDFFEKVFSEKLHDYKDCTDNENEEERRSRKNKNLLYNLGAFIIYKNKKYLIGLIIVEIHNEIQYENYSETKIEYKSELEYYDYAFNPQKSIIGYISSIGVIDEYRKNKISTELLQRINILIKQKYDIIGYYLHVIEHNQSAIRFYEKNSFSQVNRLNNYYEIDGCLYNSFVYFRSNKISEIHDFNGRSFIIKRLVEYLFLLVKIFLYVTTLFGCFLCRKIGKRGKYVLV